MSNITTALISFPAAPVTDSMAQDLATKALAIAEFPVVLDFLYDVQMSSQTSAMDKANADKIISAISVMLYS